MVHKYVALGLVMVMLLLTGCAQQDSQTTAPTVQTEPNVLQVLELREEGDFILVQTTICMVRYAYAFSDLIEVSTEGNTLLFSTVEGQGAQPLFSVGFDEGEGDMIGTLPDPETGKLLEVWVNVCPVEEKLSEDLRGTIMAAQECVNDVVDSLLDVDGFVAAP